MDEFNKRLNKLKINFLKFSIFKFFYLLKVRKFSPFSIRSKIFPGKQYSDYFIYSSTFEENLFIAENIFAIVSNEPTEIKHIFNFFSNDGEHLYEFKKTSSDFISTIKLPKLNIKSKYCSFTHHTIPSRSNLISSDLIPQHRGYTIFKKKANNLGTILHGNIGGIENHKFKTAARKRNKLFRYSPAYHFKKINQYHLIFNNPTNKPISISIEKSSLLKKGTDSNFIILKIPKFGCDFYDLNDFEGQLAFISKLPVCRAIIIKNPEKGSPNFDAFHS